MAKMICIIFGLMALIAPAIFVGQMSETGANSDTWWDFYPLFVSGFLLSLIFFFSAFQIHTKHKRKS